MRSNRRKILGIYFIQIILFIYLAGSLFADGNRLTKEEFYSICHNLILNNDCKFLYSISMAESNLDVKAVSNKKAYGLMQITEIGLKEASSYCPLINKNVEEAKQLLKKSPLISIQIADCLLSSNMVMLYNSDIQVTFEKLAATYNCGIGCVVNVKQKKRRYPKETRDYIEKVMKYYYIEQMQRRGK